MQSLFEPFLSFLLVYKYFALFILSFLATLFPLPLPISTIIAACGAFAFQGYMNIYYVLLSSFLGNIGGDIVNFLLSKYYGEKVLIKIGFKKHLGSEKYKIIKEYFFEYPKLIIFFTRFLAIVGPLTNVVMGIAQVNFLSFLIPDLIGEFLYVFAYSMTGYILGGQWENNLNFLYKIALVMLPLTVFVNLIQFYLFRKRHKYNSI